MFLLGFGVYCLTKNLTSDEWLKIYKAAVRQWPTETLSRAEIVRRYTMFGSTFKERFAG
jgi:hypothetical protein